MGVISITFDDNKRTQYDYAFPLMKTRGIVGTFYVVTDHIRDFSHESKYMSIKELHILQNCGCEIGSHSKSHAHFSSLSEPQIRDECSISKKVLKSYVFVANNFAYPYGDANKHVDSIASQYYRSARGASNHLRLIDFPIFKFGLPGYNGENDDNTKSCHDLKRRLTKCVPQTGGLFFTSTK